MSIRYPGADKRGEVNIYRHNSNADLIRRPTLERHRYQRSAVHTPRLLVWATAAHRTASQLDRQAPRQVVTTPPVGGRSSCTYCVKCSSCVTCVPPQPLFARSAERTAQPAATLLGAQERASRQGGPAWKHPSTWRAYPGQEQLRALGFSSLTVAARWWLRQRWGG